MKRYTDYAEELQGKLEEHQDEGLVERDGYLDTETQVRILIEAGERLDAYRKAEYPSEKEVPDDDEGMVPLNLVDSMFVEKEIEKNKKEMKGRLLREIEEKERLEKEKEVKKDVDA